MAVTKSYKQLLQEASEKIDTLPVEEARILVGNADVVFVDIREPHELDREGMIPDAIHVPRGVLEFIVTPDSPYFKPVFAEDRQFVLYCQSAWRSALATATLKELGLDRVCHIEGGFSAWKNAGGETCSKVPE